MQRLTESALKDLGGTSGIAKMLHTPTSTVHSWHRIGIPQSRLEHLKLAVAAKGQHVDWNSALEPVPAEREPAKAA